MYEGFLHRLNNQEPLLLIKHKCPVDVECVGSIAIKHFRLRHVHAIGSDELFFLRARIGGAHVDVGDRALISSKLGTLGPKDTCQIVLHPICVRCSYDVNIKNSILGVKKLNGLVSTNSQ